MRTRQVLGVLAACVLAPALAAAQVAPGPVLRKTNGTLFENVVAVLEEHYHDAAFRGRELPALVARYRRQALEAATVDAQRTVVHELLSNIPASHLGLMSTASLANITADLQGRPTTTFGFQLMGSGGAYLAAFVFESGPAARAGLLAGDRILAIDGLPPDRAPRLHWRSDDAFLDDERDPPIHMLAAAAGDEIRLDVERRPGERMTVVIAAEEFAAIDATRASARVIRRLARCAGYVHVWYIHISGVPALLQEKIDGDFRRCGALIVDLRGRGGSLMEVPKIVEVIRAYAATQPVIALMDRQSRSGKDILAYELKEGGLARLVGEPSAGAVLPATFADVGHDTFLMLPTFAVGRYSALLEGKPVEPHLKVERAGLHAAGVDPILRAAIDEAFRLIDEQEQAKENRR